jgi:Major Facilitator Superfamily
MGSSRRVASLLFAVAWGSNHFVPLLLVYRARLELSSVELAVLFGVYALGLAPGLVVGGPLSDRLGRRPVVLIASFVAFMGTCILGGAGVAGFPALLVGRFVVGLGAGATFSAGTAWVQDLAAGEVPGTGARRAAVALSSGFGTGPLVTGLLAQWLPLPMRLPYLVQGAVLVPSLLAVGLMAHPPPAGPRDALSGPRDDTRAAGTPRRLLPPGFGAIAIVAPWVFGFAAVSFAVLPAIVRAQLGPFAVVFAGVVTATTLLAGVLVQPMLRKWPPLRAATFGLAIGAAGLLGATVAATSLSPAGVLGSAALLGSGYGGCLIAGLRFIETNTTPATRGRVTGIYYVLTYLGFAAPLALAAIARRVGDRSSLLAALALAIATLGTLGMVAAVARGRRSGR